MKKSKTEKRFQGGLNAADQMRKQKSYDRLETDGKKAVFKDKPLNQKKSYTERVREMREKNRKGREKKRLEEKGLLKENGEEIIEELNDWGGDDADNEIGSDEILPTSDPNIGSNSIISQPGQVEKVNNSRGEDLEKVFRGHDRRVSNVSSKWHDIDEDQFSKKGDEGQLERLKQEMKEDLGDSFDEGDEGAKSKSKG
jgi:hypothetical protein